MKNYDFVVVGSGMFGASFAREAADHGKSVLVVERRDHVGGNCHSESLNGIQVHTYGPHVFHTDNFKVWTWISQFGEFLPTICRNIASANGRLWPLPLNLMLFHMLWGAQTPEEARREVERRRLPNQDERNLKGWVLGNLGQEIYETFVEGYTRKQWGREPEHLPAGIVRRLPVRFTHDQNYFRDRYQGIPWRGYGELFHRMLLHPKIEVATHVDYLSEQKSLNNRGQVIYSGRVDALHNYCLGDLEFRSVRFEHRWFDGDYQGHFAIYHCDVEVPYTRTIEHKHFTDPDNPKTIVSWEFPFECGREDNPLYPIATDRNLRLHGEYMMLPTEVVYGGRLGHYRYMDMDQAVMEGRKLAKVLS